VNSICPVRRSRCCISRSSWRHSTLHAARRRFPRRMASSKFDRGKKASPQIAQVSFVLFTLDGVGFLKTECKRKKPGTGISDLSRVCREPATSCRLAEGRMRDETSHKASCQAYAASTSMNNVFENDENPPSVLIWRARKNTRCPITPSPNFACHWA
jgi:hypothetical protein